MGFASAQTSAPTRVYYGAFKAIDAFCDGPHRIYVLYNAVNQSPISLTVVAHGCYYTGAQLKQDREFCFNDVGAVVPCVEKVR